MDRIQAEEILRKYNQEHILQYFDELNEDSRKSLLEQIGKLDFSLINIDKKNAQDDNGVIEPLEAMKLDEINEKKDYFENIGLDAIKRCKVGAVLLAGGQGTRLGFDKPKGMFNIGVNVELSIFARLVQNLMEVVDKSESYVPLFIMTSEKNHDETVDFFEENQYFGYDREYATFFVQDMAPSVDYNGKIYMEDKDRISMSPNGNGGWFSSLLNDKESVRKMNRFGIEWLNVFAVDNVLQRIADPVFIGATIDSGCVSGAKVVKKAFPDEKVGVMCKKNGHPYIVEYYELTDELRAAKDSEGEPAYNYGVILNYLFRIQELRGILNEEFPVHVVEKKIPYMDSEGNYIQPEKPNGYKFEGLILDMIMLLKNCLVFEVEREKEFAPVKNKEGVDSIDTARELLRKNGVEI